MDTPGFRFFTRTGTDIDKHVGDFHHAPPLGFGQKVRGLGTDRPDDLVTMMGLHLHPLGQKGMTPPTADRNHGQKAIGQDTLHPEAHLIHVAFHQNPGAILALLTENGSRSIRPDFTVLLEFPDEDFAHFILVPGNAVGLGEGFQQFESFVLHVESPTNPRLKLESENSNTRFFMTKVSDVNVLQNTPLPSPAVLMSEVQRTPEQADFVLKSRQDICESLFVPDSRFLLIVGPCSIHDTKACREYAEKLAKLADEVKDKILVVMRVYFEKPRTTVGWKGLIMDPDLDGSDDIPAGLKVARQFLTEILSIGLPTATELLDPITPQYIADLVSWSAIGARTSESQTHRQMASGLSMPLGFKNTTSGDIIAAINAIQAASRPQTFLGVSDQGVASAVSTAGNPHCHLILRGGDNGPNFDADSIKKTRDTLIEKGEKPSIVVDASHANCGKNCEQMPGVFEEIIRQRAAGDNSITGAMLESHLVAGNQKFPQPLSDLTYGQSITDQCIDFETTIRIVKDAANAL